MFGFFFNFVLFPNCPVVYNLAVPMITLMDQLPIDIKAIAVFACNFENKNSLAKYLFSDMASPPGGNENVPSEINE